MKRFLYIFILMLTLNLPNLFSQRDTIAMCRIYDIIRLDTNIMEFSLEVRKLKDVWNYWENATFQLQFATWYDFSGITFERLDTTQLKLGVTPGGEPSVDMYTIEQQILSDRISINVHGPEKLVDSIVIVDSTLFIGRFRVSSPNTLPRRIRWAFPYEYYQAIAFKTDVPVGPKDKELYFEEDNIEMNDYKETAVLYIVEDIPNATIAHIFAKYIGEKKISIHVVIEQEYENRGFAVFRGMRPIGNESYSYSYSDRIAHYTQPAHKPLIGKGTAKDYRVHDFIDIIEERDVEYCYMLRSFDYSGAAFELDSACVPVPFAVITYAQADPNPFDGETKVRYILDDNVKLTISLYDLTGKLLKNYMENQDMPIGEHNLYVRLPEYASNGLYDLIFIAHPKDDESIELSKAVVKLQYVR